MELAYRIHYSDTLNNKPGEVLVHFNPNHDRKGLFAKKIGGSSVPQKPVKILSKKDKEARDRNSVGNAELQEYNENRNDYGLRTEKDWRSINPESADGSHIMGDRVDVGSGKSGITMPEYGKQYANKIFSDSRMDDIIMNSKSAKEVGKILVSELGMSKKEAKKAAKTIQKDKEKAEKAQAKADKAYHEQVEKAAKTMQQFDIDRKRFDAARAVGEIQSFNALNTYAKAGQKAFNDTIDTMSDYNYIARADRQLQSRKFQNMSDAELQKIVNRKNLENNYLSAMSNRARYSKGRKIGHVVTSAATTGVTVAAGVYFARKLFDS